MIDSTAATVLGADIEKSEAGQLDGGLISSLRKGYRLEGADRARHNAVTNNDIKELALNRAATIGDDGHFSHRIKTTGITHQKKSGRCWMFAALNTLRPLMVEMCDVSKFEFSAAYLQFWDKLERSNLFFESMIELRDRDFLDREWEGVNRWTLEDGGWWNYVVGLIEKYGLVPSTAMPETHTSSNTELLNEVLGRLVRSRAIRMMDRHAAGATVDELREIKTEALAEVYRFLVISLGEPPAEFSWRFQRSADSSKERSKAVVDGLLEPEETFTPQSFFERFVGSSLKDFVCLYHDPKNELNHHYSFSRARNMVGSNCLDFVNIDMAQMKKIAVASICDKQPLWFAVNMSFDQSRTLGVMHDQLFDYDSLFGVDLSISKADRGRFYAGVSNHAMTLMGVDLGPDGAPRKWLVENSWGEEQGKDGWWTLHDSWFSEHVYTIIAHRRHVPKSILHHFDEPAIALPAWYPGAAGAV